MLACQILEAANAARLRFIPLDRMICIPAPDAQDLVVKTAVPARYAQDSDKNTVHKRKTRRLAGFRFSCAFRVTCALWEKYAQNPVMSI
jgi:hypothetical protein